MEDPLNRPPSDEEDETLDLTDRCWFDANEQVWMTDFPPPADFRGYESCDYGDLEDPEPYVSNCTPEETAILEADRAADRAAERAADEELRDEWFELLRTECSEADASQLEADAKAGGH